MRNDDVHINHELHLQVADRLYGLYEKQRNIKRREKKKVQREFEKPVGLKADESKRRIVEGTSEQIDRALATLETTSGFITGAVNKLRGGEFFFTLKFYS